MTPLIAYERKNFGNATLDVIDAINSILTSYSAQGYDLTLRQLYYQFVAHDLFPADRTWRQTGGGRWVRDPNGTPNAEPNYKWLGTIVNDGRMSGLIDWNHIVDRTREVRTMSHWEDPADIVEAISRQFKIDKWERQGDYVEVWVEKDALVGVLVGVCEDLDVPFFSCRGYTSQSAMWRASRRLLEQIEAGKRVTIIHLGDHDPSGVDMTRDIAERLWTFVAMDHFRAEIDAGRADVDRDQSRVAQFISDRLTINRVALTMAQVNQYNPPPNPAKITDSRAAAYIDQHGDLSWELDALDPPTLTALIRDAVEALKDDATWDADVARETEGRTLLDKASRYWDSIVAHLGNQP